MSDSPDFYVAVMQYVAHFLRVDPSDDHLYMRFDIAADDQSVQHDRIAHPKITRYDVANGASAATSRDVSRPLIFDTSGAAFYDLPLGSTFLGLEIVSTDYNGDTRRILWGRTNASSTDPDPPKPTVTTTVHRTFEVVYVNDAKVSAVKERGVMFER